MTYPTKGETPKAGTNGASSVKNQVFSQGVDMANDNKSYESDHPNYSFQREDSLFNPEGIEHNDFSSGGFKGYAVIAELIAKLPNDGSPNDTLDCLLVEVFQDYKSDIPTHQGRRGAAASVVYLVTEILNDAILSGRAEAVFRNEADAFFQFDLDEIERGRAELNALLPQRKEEPEVKRAKRRAAKTQEVVV